MKNISVEMNPTEIIKLDYDNDFFKTVGKSLSISMKSEASVRLNSANPVMAMVVVTTTVIDKEEIFKFEAVTITGVKVSTFVDDLEGFIKEKYMPIILTANNEKIRTVSHLIGAPIQLPNPTFGEMGTEGYTQ